MTCKNRPRYISYNVFGGTLNLAPSITAHLHSSSLNTRICLTVILLHACCTKTHILSSQLRCYSFTLLYAIHMLFCILTRLSLNEYYIPSFATVCRKQREKKKRKKIYICANNTKYIYQYTYSTIRFQILLHTTELKLLYTVQVKDSPSVSK